MPDMTHPLDTFDGQGAKEAAERAADKVWRPRARAMGFDVEVRTVEHHTRRYQGRMVTPATWGVFLAPLAEGQQGAQDAPRERREPHAQSS